MTDRCKTAICISLTLALLGVVGGILWDQEWKYALPTPRPPHLKQVPLGVRLPLPAALSGIASARDDRPLLLHFFNPGCPCSRFNLSHVRRLLDRYRGQVRFVAILEGEDAEPPQSAFRAYGLPMDAVTDTSGAIARACGVYSTPQAVLLDRSGRLYYRGNYNTARYCTDAATEFARIALDAVICGKDPPSFPPVASRAYGCALPFHAARMQTRE